MKPAREVARNNGQTYFVTFQTACRKPLFRHERWTLLLLNTLERYSKADEYKLHDFVVMPDHIHLLLTPSGALERSAQLITGGFSFQAKRAFQWQEEVWQAGFTDHRIRDWVDWEEHITYIARNVASLGQQDYSFCGKGGRLPLASAPQWLKPHPI